MLRLKGNTMHKYQYFSCIADENYDKPIKRGDQYQEPSGKWRDFTDFIGHPMGAWLLTDTIRRPIKFISCRDCKHFIYQGSGDIDDWCGNCQHYLIDKFEPK
jgi:hypothetical protein